MARRITIFERAPSKGVLMALQPIGAYCNKDLQKALAGQMLTLQDSWSRTQMRLVRKSKVPIHSSIFTALSKAIYGEHIGWEEIRARWEAVGVSEGWGENGFSTEECLLLVLEAAENKNLKI